MIEFTKEVLSNGLTVLFHHDPKTPLVAVNTLYKVGARDEDPDRTGFAHLFEHLMFGGSKNAPDFDKPLQRAGGQNNAFTNNDITNYYVTLPGENLDTALWLESDRMLHLELSERSLDVQRKVVVEEFRQRYLNQPYGELWLELRKMAYSEHPYRWATIGKSISHIEEASLTDVEQFFNRFYSPSNAILCLSGNIDVRKTLNKVEDWYGDIPDGPVINRSYPSEPDIPEYNLNTLNRNVPLNAFHLAWLMCGRMDSDYAAFDLLSDVLSNGKSSRLYRRLVIEKGIFTRLSAFITGSLDRGLFVISAMPSGKIDLDEAKSAVINELEILAKEGPERKELEKVKNKILVQKAMSEISILSNAMNLCYYEMLESPELINTYHLSYKAVQEKDLSRLANTLLNSNHVELRYISNNGS